MTYEPFTRRQLWQMRLYDLKWNVILIVAWLAPGMIIMGLAWWVK